MRDEDKLDAVIAEAAKDWRTGPPVDADALWQQIDAQAFSAPPRQWVAGWRVLALATAASLLLGVALGRGTASFGAQSSVLPDSQVAEVATTPVDKSYEQATEELLGRTALLLAALPAGNLPPGPSNVIAKQGGELLTTTRLLLDSPSASTPEMRRLLQDLELVLAQVARLRGPSDNDLELIHDALDRNEIVPRLRSAVVGSSTELP